MNNRHWIVTALLYVVAAFWVAMGVFYLSSSRIMPYHEQFLGMTQEQLQPQVTHLLLVLMKVFGTCTAALGIGVALVVGGPFRKGDKWAWWAVAVLTVLPAVLVTYFTRSVPSSPWWSVAIVLAITVVALALSILPAPVNRPSINAGASR